MIPMIPVRVPTDFPAHIVRDDMTLTPDHPLYGDPCPACGDPMTEDERIALVAVGIIPIDRDRRFATGGAVAVHAACAGSRFAGNDSQAEVDHTDPDITRVPPAAAVEELRALLGRLPAPPWMVHDVEGDLQVWPESELRKVTRDEDGEITGYRTPSSLGLLLAEWDLDSWDSGQDDRDDLRRDVAQLLVLARNLLPGLLTEVTEAQDMVSGKLSIDSWLCRRVERAEADALAAREALVTAEAAADRVRAVCDEGERQATRWEQPFPVPSWVTDVRAALAGGTPNEETTR
jgi:hypothetical protein